MLRSVFDGDERVILACVAISQAAPEMTETYGARRLQLDRAGQDRAWAEQEADEAEQAGRRQAEEAAAAEARLRRGFKTLLRAGNLRVSYGGLRPCPPW